MTKFEEILKQHNEEEEKVENLIRGLMDTRKELRETKNDYFDLKKNILSLSEKDERAKEIEKDVDEKLHSILERQKSLDERIIDFIQKQFKVSGEANEAAQEFFDAATRRMSS
jgi:uncharacterized coiled-coil DUF342 family protein